LTLADIGVDVGASRSRPLRVGVAALVKPLDANVRYACAAPAARAARAVCSIGDARVPSIVVGDGVEQRVN